MVVHQYIYRPKDSSNFSDGDGDIQIYGAAFGRKKRVQEY